MITKKVPIIIFLCMVCMCGYLSADRTHHGNLVIQGNDVFKIENETFHMINGDLTVKDNGRLVIRNSTFRYQTNYQGEFSWYIRDKGNVLVVNSSIQDRYTNGVHIHDNGIMIYNHSNNEGPHASHGGQAVRVYDSGRFELRNNSSIVGIDITGIKPGDQSRVIIENSELWALGMFLYNDQKIVISNLDTEKVINYWRLPENGSQNIPFDVTVKNSRIKADVNALCSDSVTVEIQNSKKVAVYLANSAKLIAQNSYFRGIELGIYNNLKIKAMAPGFIQSFDLGAYSTGTSIGVKLTNCTVTWWDIDIRKGKVEVVNSHLFQLQNSQMSEVTVSKSTIEALRFHDFHNKIHFISTNIKEWYDTVEGDFLFTGTVQIGVPRIVETAFGPCRNIKVTRIFPLTLIPGVELEVFSQNKESVWKGETDSDGNAQIKLSFDCTNYNEWFLLRIKPQNRQKPIKLGSSTPLLQIYPPRNLQLFKQEKRYLFKNIFSNTITWNKNPENNWCEISKYKIYYQPSGSTQLTLLAEVPGTNLSYTHENIQNMAYEYAIVTVSEFGTESNFSEILKIN